MGYQAEFLKEDRIYKGKRKTLRFAVYADAACTVPLDIAAIALIWRLTAVQGGTPPLISKTSPSSGITISGTFNASPSLNTQRALVELQAGDWAAVPAGDYWHELARTDNGFEDVLADGRFHVRAAVTA